TADGRGRSIWDTFAQIPGTVLGQQDGRTALDHYHRFEQDVAIMADLGLSAYRFSVAWPRIVPDGHGAVEARGIAFYRRLLESVRAAGIEPVATLYHWDLPQPLQDRRGGAHREAGAAFSRYAGGGQGEPGGLGDRWRTVNGPWARAVLGH